MSRTCSQWLLANEHDNSLQVFGLTDLSETMTWTCVRTFLKLCRDVCVCVCEFSHNIRISGNRTWQMCPTHWCWQVSMIALPFRIDNIISTALSASVRTHESCLPGDQVALPATDFAADPSVPAGGSSRSARKCPGPRSSPGNWRKLLLGVATRPACRCIPVS